MSALTIVLMAYTTVLVTELLGDKTLFTVSALASRYRASGIFAGLTLAFMLKMLAAVMLGELIASLPKPLVTAVAVAGFTFAAAAAWRGAGPETSTAPGTTAPGSRRGAISAFTAIVVVEWGDIGMVTAATLAAHYDAPLLVWIAATCAMLTKGAFAIALGTGLRRYLPRERVRYVAVAVCVVMAILTLTGVHI
jgi:putative Ca2+/H+ antiporter (TMEM165/GDT1 family)